MKDKLETAVVRAVDLPGSVIYAFGAKWGPEKVKPDKYFKFVPGNRVHDIHMNQGNGGKYKKDNGIYQDGALIFEYPDDKWRGFFFAFQSQTFNTDNRGNPVKIPKGQVTPDKPLATRKKRSKKQVRKAVKSGEKRRRRTG